MSKVVDVQGLDILFREARTHNGWVNEEVSDALLRQVYDLAKMGPTSANMCPMRVVFVKTPDAKEKLKPLLDEGNVKKTMAAPVTAIFITKGGIHSQPFPPLRCSDDHHSSRTRCDWRNDWNFPVFPRFGARHKHVCARRNSELVNCFSTIHHRRGRCLFIDDCR